jgi:hypothetical protein
MKSTQRGWIAKRSITVGDAVKSLISDGGGADGIQHATSGTAYNLPRTTSGVQPMDSGSDSSALGWRGSGLTSRTTRPDQGKWEWARR